MFGLFKNKKKSPPKLVASDVVPRIKHRNFLDFIASAGMPREQEPYTEPLVGDLLVTYAFDLPEEFQMVRKIDLTELGIVPSQLRSIAVANLKSRVGMGGYQGDPPVLRVGLGKNFDACTLLYDDLWTMLSEKIPPEIVVGVPHRDVVLLTTTASTKGGLEQIRAMVNQLYAQDEVHGLTRDLFVRRQNHWDVFEKASN
ncbi:MAG: DUF1444 family protein [Planctomycetaceae bacterium]